MFAPLRTVTRTAAIALGAALILAACGDSDDAATATSTTSAVTAAPVTSTTAAVQPDDGGDTVVITTAPPTTSETTEAPTTTAVPSTTTTPRPDGLVLLADGLGPLEFGASPESAIEFLSAALGTPMADSGWTDSFSVYGTCPGSEVRGVEWPGFLALFGDADDDYSDGGRHFMAWTVGWFGPDPFGMKTEDGIGIGATRDEVASTYLSATFFPADELFPPSVQILTSRGTLQGYFGEDDAILSSVSAGTPCGE